MQTFVRAARGWELFFDATDSFLSGAGFGLRAKEYQVVEDSARRKAARFSGVNQSPSFPWTLLVEAEADNSDATVVVRATESGRLEERLKAVRKARSRLSVAYADLQRGARDRPDARDCQALTRDFRRAHQHYREGDFQRSAPEAAATASR